MDYNALLPDHMIKAGDTHIAATTHAIEKVITEYRSERKNNIGGGSDVAGQVTVIKSVIAPNYSTRASFSSPAAILRELSAGGRGGASNCATCKCFLL
jgi:hypothetical protein